MDHSETKKQEISQLTSEEVESSINEGKSAEEILHLENGLVPPSVFELLSLTSQF